MKNYVVESFFGPIDRPAFSDGIQKAIYQLPPYGIFFGDNLFTFGKSLGFLNDEPFMSAVARHAETTIEKAAIWRTHVLCWAARRALKLDGDFVECGCYKGTSARIVMDYVGFAETPRHFYLYDLFDHSPDMPHGSMPAHSPGLYDSVCRRFANMPNVSVIAGKVPESFEQKAPQKIAFLHIDMNNADAELGALRVLFDRVVPGAAIIFDDYGWVAYQEQKVAEDGFFADRGYQILELPTGQGLLIA